jgi:hypothetical protein
VEALRWRNVRGAQSLSAVPTIFDEKHRIDQKPDGHECREPDRDHQIEPIVIAAHRSVVDQRLAGPHTDSNMLAPDFHRREM